MGGLFPAERYIRELLAAGKPVVSANKQLLAARGRELSLAAETAALPLRFEAAVCGAVPIVRTICEALPPGSVHRIRGIVNGTTNFVLTRMEDGVSLVDALGEARHAGYAEADATDDLSGADAAAKMALLACVAFGEHVTLADVDWRGIADVSPRMLATARAAGRRLRLVGEACREDGALRVRVAPTELLDADPLAKVPAAFNQIELEGSGFQQLTLRGPGAGRARDRDRRDRRHPRDRKRRRRCDRKQIAPAHRRKPNGGGRVMTTRRDLLARAQEPRSRSSITSYVDYEKEVCQA